MSFDTSLNEAQSNVAENDFYCPGTFQRCLPDNTTERGMNAAP
ncbi:hypothetical protein [Paraburkholderia edwinii]|jgi:hypothetical protein|nr:hypothetical protein [Paraburkholderia edwinii]